MAELSRRLFLTSAAAFIAAPAIMRVAPIMPISVERPPILVTHLMDTRGNTYRWFVDEVNSMARQVVAERLGYTFIPEKTVILNEAGLPSTANHGPTRLYDDGRRIARLAYIPNEEYRRHQAAKEAMIALKNKGLEIKS